MSKLVQLFAIALMACLAVISVPSLPALLGVSLAAAAELWRWAVTLLAFGGAAFIFAGLLSPLEALGWWAGWYGDEVETAASPGIVERPIASDEIDRYVIYLDGIGQADHTYLPDVETFLDQLEAALPNDIILLRGIMPYSVLNRPLTEDRLLAFLWRFAARMQVSGYGSLTGTLTSIIINLRNVLIVTVSADRRYGPIYNQGAAQVMYNSLIAHGYQRGTPITLIGFSGGGQIAMGAVPFLKEAIAAPIEVISIAGVISGNVNALKVEHLYHLVGNKDFLERLGPVLFPRRWKLLPLSYWNRAKQKGKISVVSLGPVGHNGAGSPLDPTARLPDNRTHLQQTLEIVTGIILDTSPIEREWRDRPRQPSNYDRYQQAAFNRPDFYPLHASVDPEHYRPIAPWTGRLILPKLEQRRQVRGVWFEVHHAPPEQQDWVGRVVPLRWSSAPRVQAYRRTVTKDVHFNDDAYYSHSQGIDHPCRLNHWRRVDPLESLAGARAHDDIIVKLIRPIVVEETNPKTGSTTAALLIDREPVQITGRFYALVQILRPLGGDRFRVAHYRRDSQQFDGAEETVRFPAVVPNQEGVPASTTANLARNPLNAAGWYIYGAPDREGTFVVQAIAPRQLLRLQPDAVIAGERAAWRYLKHEAWKDAAQQRGEVRSVLLCPQQPDAPSPQPPSWRVGDVALVLHTYGGIGGSKREPAARTPIYFGHFAYGIARVVQEPIADQPVFDVEYRQVYTHNTDGLVAGALAWNRYVGDRQFGWLGVRPICDLLVKLDAFTEGYELTKTGRSALEVFIDQLEVMTARYRIGDGTGGTYVGFAHNCAQDSNQALYAALRRLRRSVELSASQQAALNSLQQEQLEALIDLTEALRRQLLPFGAARADWQSSEEETLGISPEEDLFEELFRGLKSWRSLLPRFACETIARLFLQRGAAIWVLRTNQVGGENPDIEPIAPTQIGW